VHQLHISRCDTITASALQRVSLTKLRCKPTPTDERMVVPSSNLVEILYPWSITYEDLAQLKVKGQHKTHLASATTKGEGQEIPTDESSSSSRMRVIYHNWSATKQRPHPQSVAEISHHSVLSGDRIRQCETSSGSRHKDTDQCL